VIYSFKRQSLNSLIKPIPCTQKNPAEAIHHRIRKKKKMNYQPDKSPEPDKWLALDEGERVVLIQAKVDHPKT
jgi:hypothetical protein